MVYPMSMILPITAASLALAHSEAEDRLSLVAADAHGTRLHVALTRRLTDRLINGLAHLLEQSSAIASQAPAEMRDDIILMEHQSALFGQADSPQQPAVAPAADAVPPPAPQLVNGVDVTVTPTTFEIQLRAGEARLVHLSLNRLQVHQLVETLSQRAEVAGWNIALGAAWMEPGQTKIVFN